MTIYNPHNLTEEEFLQQYDPNAFDRLSLSIDTVIFSINVDPQTINYRKLDDQKLAILLVKRSDHPFLGRWALPGGFVGMQETLDEAARRILQNKTGLDDLYMEQLYTYGAPNRDPRMRIISCSYLSLIDSSKYQLHVSELVEDSAWFEVELIEEKGCLRISNGETTFLVKIEQKSVRKGKQIITSWQVAAESKLAFDHDAIILDGLLRLRGKIQSTDIVFNLMPELFSITQLQQIYEIILGQKLLAPAFRRKIAHTIVETGQYSQDKGHRPSQLFTYQQR